MKPDHLHQATEVRTALRGQNGPRQPAGVTITVACELRQKSDHENDGVDPECLCGLLDLGERGDMPDALGYIRSES